MTTDQLPLGLFVPPAPDPKLTIQEAFERFHADNPWVYAALEHLTADWLAHGHTRAGISMFVERVRWEFGRRTSTDDFRLNNNFRSRYVRLLIADHPEWESVFATRALKAA